MYARFLQHEHDAERVRTEQLRSFLAIQEGYERTTRWLHDQEKIAQGVQQMIASLDAMERTRTLAAEAASWDRLLRREIAEQQQMKLLAAHAFGSWHASWQTMQNQLGLLPSQLVRVVSGSALAPSLALSDFSRETISQIARAESTTNERVQPLQASLVLAESQVEGATTILSATLGRFSDSGASREEGGSGAREASRGSRADTDTATPGGTTRGTGEGGGGRRGRGSGPPPRPTGGADDEGEPEGQARTYATALFISQRTELVGAGPWPHAPTAPEIIARSPTAQTQRLAEGVVTRIAAVNQTRRIQGHDDVFTPTTRMITATTELLLTNVVDVVTLGVAVDALWYLVYEGSGDLKRVFGVRRPRPLRRRVRVQASPKQVAPPRRRPRFRQGPEASWRALGTALQHFGTDRVPQTGGECARLYTNVLTSLTSWLDEVADSAFRDAAPRS